MSQPQTIALNMKKHHADPSALFYVGLSRAKELSQIHIVDTFKRGSIRCSADAKSELSRLEKISLNRNPSPWWSEEDGVIYRIATINCRGLQVSNVFFFKIPKLTEILLQSGHPKSFFYSYFSPFLTRKMQNRPPRRKLNS